MSLTLLVEDNPKIHSVYTLNLTTWIGAHVTVKKSSEEALELLKGPEGKNYGLVIARFKSTSPTGQKEFISYLKTTTKIPVIEIGPETIFETPEAYIPNSLELKLLIKSAAKALNITAKDMSEKVVPDFFPIPIAYFMVIKRSTCPVFKANGKDYLELTKGNLDFSANLISDLARAGEKHLYVDKLDRLSFVNYVTSELLSLLSPEEVSPSEHLTASEKSMELLTKKLQTIGVNEETIKLAQKNMDVMKQNVRSSPKLSGLFEKLLSNKSSYRFKHTQILTYIGLHIIKNIEWGNQEQEEKMSFIAYFHDIALNTDEETMIHSNLDLKKSSLNHQSKLLVEKHAQIAAELVAKYPHAPMGADQLIRQHHGTLNGIGFSEHFGSNISPMAVVFILAEEFTRIVLKNESLPLNRENMIKELKDTFPTARFQKIIDLIQKITF